MARTKKIIIDKCDDCHQDITECLNCCDLSCGCEDGCTCNEVKSGGGNAS